MKIRNILWVDAVINCILGFLLLAFSPWIVHFFGVPDSESYFYPNILGGVLLGIGLALFIEANRKDHSFVGLGLGGAVSINLCGGIALVYWLIFGNLKVPVKGRIFLWGLAVILVVLSGFEIYFHRALSRKLYP
jgi:Na+-driven multidrug efflux pump